MNTSVTSATHTQPRPQFVACIGLDWGDETHAFSLCAEADKTPVQTGTLANSPETLHRWLQELAQRFGGQPVALALETSRGPLIHLFGAYPWLTLYPIHPATSARYRSAFKPSGAKDDQPDALVLLELVRCHRDKLHPLQLPEPATRKLGALVQLRRNLVDRRTQVVLQLESLLKSYYPQALELVGHELTTSLALDFLRRWPDLLALKAARPATLKRFYYQHSVRSTDLVEQRQTLVQKALALTTDEAVLEPARWHLAVLVEQLRTFQKHIVHLEKQSHQLFKQHSEAYLFIDLPGAGQALQPRLLVAFGEDRCLYPDPGSLQKYLGRGSRHRKERLPALDPLALACPPVLAPDLCRMGRPNRRLLHLGQGLLPMHEDQRQEPPRHPPGSGLQVDSHSLEMLANPHPL